MPKQKSDGCLPQAINYRLKPEKTTKPEIIQKNSIEPAMKRNGRLPIENISNYTLKMTNLFFGSN